MCELLAMSANVPTDICFSFSGLMQRGGNTGPHKDGWGITFYEGKGCRSFKDAKPSAESKIAELVQNYPIKSEAVISHIRQANSGEVCLENTHPFTRQLWGKNWTYAHNGQLCKKDSEGNVIANEEYKEKLPVKLHIPVGCTDSEHAFCWILDQLHYEFSDTGKDNQPNAQKLFQFIASLCDQINELGVFNLILSDGEYVFAYCSNNLHYITRRAPFQEASLIDAEMVVDFKKETTPNDVVTVIATQPLTDNEEWYQFSSKEWKVFRKGNLCPYT